MSTLDHLTGGRVGWNIVTGYLDSAARGMGLTAQPDHDRRYDAADEYMSVPPDRVFRGADHAS
jgi:alkanesulfonate monooxygenase SsuD/methylene tetrahydromethanopterin reductase-like flavin-dependent oxidoreductase (luciferase family)